MSLKNFCKQYNVQTDKYQLGYIHEFYDKLFSSRQNQEIKLLEIGIYSGYSLLLWRDYFTKGEITGIDVNYCKNVDQKERINPIYTNAYDLNFVDTLPDEYYDIVIDDGPHTFESMHFFLTHYTKKLKKGGLLILEDIIDRAWTPKLLNILTQQNIGQAQVFDMRNKQLNNFLLERWRNGLDVITLEKT
jgi:predicted O-methyltransferase YrrM